MSQRNLSFTLWVSDIFSSKRKLTHTYRFVEESRERISMISSWSAWANDRKTRSKREFLGEVILKGPNILRWVEGDTEAKGH